MRWSKLEIWNSVRETSRRMSKAAPVHMKTSLWIINYYIEIIYWDWILKPIQERIANIKSLNILSKEKYIQILLLPNNAEEDKSITVKSGM